MPFPFQTVHESVEMFGLFHNKHNFVLLLTTAFQWYNPFLNLIDLLFIKLLKGNVTLNLMFYYALGFWSSETYSKSPLTNNNLQFIALAWFSS